MPPTDIVPMIAASSKPESTQEELAKDFKKYVEIEAGRRADEVADRKKREEYEAERNRLEAAALKETNKNDKLEDSDRNTQNKNQKDDAKNEGKLAAAWKGVKAGTGFVNSAAKGGAGMIKEASKSSTLALILGLVLAFVCYRMVLTAQSTTIIFAANFIMLLYCWTSYGSESIYVFTVAFFLPLIAYGIVSGSGIPIWLIVIPALILVCFTPQVRAALTSSRIPFIMTIIFVWLMFAGLLLSRIRLGDVWFAGEGFDQKSLLGSFLYSFSNQFLNITWIFYIAVLKNPGNKIITALIKIIVLLFVFVFLMAGPLNAAGVSLPGVNSPLVTEESRQQFMDMLKQGAASVNGVPLLDNLYTGIAGLFSYVTNVPMIAENFSKAMSASGAPAEDVVIAGLDLVLSPYAEKTFGPDNPNAYVYAAIRESQKIKDAIKFTDAKYKIDNKIRTDCTLDSKPFYLYYPEGAEFVCSVGKACTYDAATKQCPCPTAQAAPPWCLTIGSHSIETRAMYEMTTTSSYTPIFVDRVKKIAAEAGGQSVLAQCGLQEYAMPVARYTPSNSPASLGIVLSQDKMPVVVGEGLKDAPTEAPLWLIVSLKKVHNGFVSQVSGTEPATETDIIKGDKLGVIVKLPTGLILMTTDSLCDFDANGVGKKKTIYNAESGDVISWRCKLKKIDPNALLGNALCTPVTITATATYEFTIRMTSSVQVVPPEAEN